VNERTTPGWAELAGNRHAPRPVRQTGRMRRTDGRTSDFGVLVVCTGNICRSPAGERLLRHTLSATRVDVTSAGTHAVVGHPVEPSMARLLSADGIDASGFAARGLTERLVRDADLVLTMETGHRSAVVQTHPQALGRAFTLREFAYLLEACRDADPTAYLQDKGTDPGARLRALVELATDSRARRLSPPCPAPDIEDPYRRGDEAYQLAYAAIRAAADAIVAHVTGDPG